MHASALAKGIDIALYNFKKFTFCNEISTIRIVLLFFKLETFALSNALKEIAIISSILIKFYLLEKNQKLLA